MSARVKALVLATIVGLATLSCKGGGEPGQAARPAARRLPVRAAPVVARDVVYTVKALGSLEPEELVHITAEVNGAVSEVLFNAGDEVTADTVLSRIDTDRYRLEAERAEAAHRRAVADWKRAEADLARREELAKSQLVAAEELNRARQETERLAADAAAARAGLEIALLNRRRSEVRSPQSGEIDTRTVNTGQFVQIGDVLATLVDPRRLRLRFKVSDTESLKVAEGQRVSFRCAPLGDTELAATVYHVGDVADPLTRQVEVLAWVDNPGSLKPGFFAEVTLTTDTHQGAIVVAESAVQASEQGFVVYVVEEGKAQARSVTLGLRTGDGWVEVASGVAESEVVVTQGSDRLASGMAVDVVATAPEPAGGAR